ncbi:hypothetical protein SEA_SBLACKBERRY_58 [Microbacterium phage SBlackberry]|nr:hypothetical protein SEA_SBLACKBERRY_58 [Microbacterium phage SBlackberry]
MTAASQPQTTNRLDCLCGCGQTTSAKANYRPGHDASHVSMLLADIVAHGDLSQGAVKEYLKALPSGALQLKLQNAVDNFAAKQSAKKPRAAKVERDEWVDIDTDEYKLGRWTYPVQALMLKEGVAPKHPGEESEYKELRRNTKRDGSGEWVALEGGELIGR